MKNLKKVLALVMAFAMAFTMFAGAVDFSDVKPGDDYSAAISMLSDLEVVSGNGKGAYEPAKAVTRAEACVLIANMMNGGKADTARFAGGSNFSDVAHGWWGESAIAYCVQNGITYGVGGGKFAPNREITDAEFVAMMTRAMGYDTAANPLSFPYGNYTAAVNNGLLDNIPYVEGSDCTKGESAQIIYDALFADYARLTANLNVIHNADDHDNATLIEDVFGLTRASDKKDADDKCTQHYWVIVEESCEDEDVIFVQPIADKSGEICGDVESIECTTDVSALIGYKVVLWGEDKHGSVNKDGEIDTVLAVEVVDDQVAYDYNPTMDDGDNDGDLEELDVEVTKAAEKAMAEKNGFSYVLIDWDNDGEIDWTNTTERYYGEVTALTSKKVVISVGDKTYTLDLADGETDEYDCFCGADDHDYVVELNAEKGDIVEVTADCAYDCALTISIDAVESVEKEFTKWNSKGDRYFDGEVMEDAGDHANDVVAGYETVAGLKKADVDAEYEIWTNANGYVIAMEKVGSSADGYLMVLGVADGKYVGVASKNEKATMEVMYTDGTTADVDVAFDAEIAEYDTDKYEFSDETKLVGGVFEYTLNDDGDIDELSFVKAYDKSYSYDADYETIEWANKNDVYLTGEDFIFVVGQDYVESDKTSHGVVYTVDEDKVVVLALDELKDIDDDGDNKYGIAELGAYKSFAVARTETYNENQNTSKDYVDGVVFVVADLDAYLDTKTTKVGLITEISYTNNDEYEFEMLLDGASKSYEYNSVKVENDEEADEIAPYANDADIIEDIVADGGELYKDSTYGYGLYAAVTFNKDDEICEIELLVEVGNDGMEPKAETKCDYYVERGVVTELGKSTFRVFNDTKKVVAASDKKIATIDEYKDVAAFQFEYTDDMFVYVDAEVPGMEAGVALKNNIAFHKDSEFDLGGKDDIVASQFSKTELADIYSVVDVIYEIDDSDLLAVGVFAFDEVEEDVEYVAPVVYTLTADTTVAGSVAAHLFADGEQVAKADVDKIADASFAVYVKREKADQSDVSDEGEMEWVKLEIENVKSLNDKGDMGIFFKTGSALANGETAYVVLEGAMGDVDLDVVSSQIDIEIK